MTTQAWEYFMIMCRYLSFTDTAEHFYTTQPTVSKRIAALERALGVKLFNRGYRSVTLTEAGKILYQYYLRKNGMLNEALKKARALQEGANKLISIGLLDGLYIRGLSTAMSNIENKIDVKIERVERARPQELNMNLVKEQNDVIITTWPMIENKIRFESEIITAEPLMLYCPTDISGDLSKQVNLRQFQGMPQLTYNYEMDPAMAKDNDMLREFMLAKHGLDLGYTIQLNSFGSIISSVEAGLGVAILPNRNDIPWRKTIRCVPIGMDVDIVIAWRKGDLNPDTKLVVSYLEHSVAQKDRVVHKGQSAVRAI